MKKYRIMVVTLCVIVPLTILVNDAVKYAGMLGLGMYSSWTPFLLKSAIVLVLGTINLVGWWVALKHVR